MNPFKEPGIAYWSKADDVMMCGCIDIGIAIRKIISKRIAKLEYNKLHQDSCQRYEQVSFITSIFKQELRKRFGICRVTGLDPVCKTVKPGKFADHIAAKIGSFKS